ncbi:hypothetical protein N7495_004397 [Penicillium taxi]|uniref:uncharacterized protein n=1 Tax=Penicillium taxi TaxID=168475 RepID=UPI0025456863|nr:uncharacterized protein N7495_004397 [Penicillium taxi]KAJ5899653.1 hypothetical protein N7495_004397 [Penicillium taxi]
MSATLDEQITTLEKYTACDVSDALLKLQPVPEGSVPRAGYLVDLVPFSPIFGRNDTAKKVAAPATTFKFLSKNDSIPSIAIENPEKHGFPPGKNWVDYTGDFAAVDPSKVGSIVVIEQPNGQYCAVTGGNMATRMKVLGIKATVVSGRVRDLRELQAAGLPIWARATSTVGTGAEAKPAVRNVPINVGGVTVSPGDIIFCDPVEGVVAIPRDLLGPVLELMPKLASIEAKVKEALEQGMSVTEAFKKFRGAK